MIDVKRLREDVKDIICDSPNNENELWELAMNMFNTVEKEVRFSKFYPRYEEFDKREDALDRVKEIKNALEMIFGNNYGLDVEVIEAPFGDAIRILPLVWTRTDFGVILRNGKER